MPLFGITFLFSFLVVGLSVPILIQLSHRFAWGLAMPEKRKMHQQPVPQIGGIAFWLPLLLAAILLHSRLFWILLLAAGAVSIVGLMDDIRESSPLLRLSVQGAAAFFLFQEGMQITTVSHPVQGFISLGMLSLPLTLIWIVGVTNAMNFIDGLDGLATGLTLIAAITFFVLSFRFSHPLPIVWGLTGVLAGCMAGFLRFNFFPAKIFMGDGGAYLIGFLLASLSIVGPFKSVFFFMLIAPLMAIALPLLDMATSVVRRLLQGQNPAEPDRKHLHHQLIELGFSPRQAVIFLYLISTLLALMALYITQPL